MTLAPNMPTCRFSPTCSSTRSSWTAALSQSWPANPINQMLVRDIIQICRARDMTCVAEGVENQEQIAALLETGCNYAQGYLLRPAAPSPRI